MDLTVYSADEWRCQVMESKFLDTTTVCKREWSCARTWRCWEHRTHLNTKAHIEQEVFWEETIEKGKKRPRKQLLSKPPVCSRLGCIILITLYMEVRSTGCDSVKNPFPKSRGCIDTECSTPYPGYVPRYVSQNFFDHIAQFSSCMCSWVVIA